jgi:hypothetical protein
MNARQGLGFPDRHPTEMSATCVVDRVDGGFTISVPETEQTESSQTQVIRVPHIFHSTSLRRRALVWL